MPVRCLHSGCPLSGKLALPGRSLTLTPGTYIADKIALKGFSIRHERQKDKSAWFSVQKAECQSMQHGTNAAERGGKLVGVVSGGILELLEQLVDRGTHLRVVCGLGVFRVGDIERVDRRGGLLRGALVGDGDVFRVVGDALHHAQCDGLIVLHGGQAFGDPLRKWRSGGRRRCDDIAIWVELAHFAGNSEKMLVELLAVGGIDLLRQQSKDGVARRVPRGIPWAAAFVSMLLAPTVFRRAQRMVAGEARKLGILRPDVFLVVAFPAGTPDEAIHLRAKLHCLAGAPIPNAS